MSDAGSPPAPDTPRHTASRGGSNISLTNAAETEILDLLFNNNNWANVGDATGVRGSTTAGVFYLSLHTADPGEGGSQNTNEVGYTSYARVSVARSAAGWTVSGNTATLVAAASFPACTGGSATATHFGVGTDASGAGNLIFKGTITPNISIAVGVTPVLTTATQVSVD